VKERPILFSGAMVKAIMSGRKTQTRRVIKPQPVNAIFHNGNWIEAKCELSNKDRVLKCPYGLINDRLWVRETWRIWEGASFSETGEPYDPDVIVGSLSGIDIEYLKSRPIEYMADSQDEGPWRPSIFMPRWVSRISLEIVDIRVERVQDISEEDAKHEGVRGIPKWESFTGLKCESMGFYPYERRRAAFGLLWDSINGKKYPWESNPWVWVIEFKRT
jgi:hypothetical protein